VPIGRRADAREVAYPILSLSSVDGSVLMVYGGQFTKSDNGRVPKVALIPAATGEMTSRPAFRYQAFYKTGKTRSATANRCCAGGADYGGMVHAPAAAPILPKNSPCLAPKSPLTLEARKHHTMIVETTCCARGTLRNALNHGGAID